MFDWLQIDPASLVAIIMSAIASAGGISAIIFAIRGFIQGKITRKQTQEAITAGFQQMVLPSNITIDATGKMKQYLGGIAAELKSVVEMELTPVKMVLAILVKIMSNTAAAGKLSDEEKAKLQEVYNIITGVSMDVEV